MRTYVRILRVLELPPRPLPPSVSAHQRVPGEGRLGTELRDVVDGRAGLDPAELSDAALASELLALRAQMVRLDGVFARLATAAHARGVGASDGAASTAAWLRWQAGMREGDARDAVEAGEATDIVNDNGAA